MREGEKEGEIYHFYTKERFKEGIEANEFSRVGRSSPRQLLRID